MYRIGEIERKSVCVQVVVVATSQNKMCESLRCESCN